MSYPLGIIEHMFDEGKVMWERLPEGMAGMAPGPELAQVLATVDRTRLNGHDLVVLLQAHNRQLAHYQAELYADMAEIAHCPDGDEFTEPQRQEPINPHRADEIGTALCWTRHRAGNELSLALELYEGLPDVWQSLLKGRIDGPQARTFAYNTEHLEADTARRIADQLLDQAPGWTTGQLHARLRRLCLETNPDEAADRYSESLEERKIILSANPNGTANLSGYQLPPDRANHIAGLINRIALRLKTKDETRSMDQLRADIYLDLLSGNRHHHGTHADASRGVVDITVNLQTLIGLAEEPGEIPGWGPVVSDLARQIADQQQDSEWRYTVVDREGAVVADGVTRRRPTASQRRNVEAKHRSCVFPGCRMPARQCDLDHRRAWAQGGRTSCGNLAPLCRHHHQLKDHGWQLVLNHAGQHKWISPLGHTYSNHPP